LTGLTGLENKPPVWLHRPGLKFNFNAKAQRRAKAAATIRGYVLHQTVREIWHKRIIFPGQTHLN
jgi:hypothetical protein